MDGDASSSSGPKRISFAEVAARQVRPQYDLNSGMRSRCTLEQLCNKMGPWKDPLRRDKITRKYQLVFRHIIQAIYNLNKQNITKGYLRPVDIMTGGVDEEATIAWLTNPPQTNNSSADGYISNFISLVKEILGINDLELQEDSELAHFLKMAESATNSDCRFRLKQLRFHPFLLSSFERSEFVWHTLIHLKTEQPSFTIWKNDFRNEITRAVPVWSMVHDVKYFSEVYKHNNKEGNREENALGAYLYSRNAMVHVNDHVTSYFNEQYKGINRKEIPKLPPDLMSQEQIVEKLTSFFPHMLVDVHEFLVNRGIGVH